MRLPHLLFHLRSQSGSRTSRRALRPSSRPRDASHSRVGVKPHHRARRPSRQPRKRSSKSPTPERRPSDDRVRFDSPVHRRASAITMRRGTRADVRVLPVRIPSRSSLVRAPRRPLATIETLRPRSEPAKQPSHPEARHRDPSAATTSPARTSSAWSRRVSTSSPAPWKPRTTG